MEKCVVSESNPDPPRKPDRSAVWIEFFKMLGLVVPPICALVLAILHAPK